jgi:hypothetical protein
MPKHSVLLICGIVAALPGLAYAGSKATSGDQTLQVSASLSPNKASATKAGRGVVLKINVDYESLNDGAQIKENTKQVLFVGPSGVKFHADRAAQCKLSDMNKPDATGTPTGGAACPPGSQVGTGTATADARPTLPDPVPATVTLYNGIDDVNTDGSPRNPGVPAVILYAKTNIGAVSILPFDILGNKLQLDFGTPTPGQAQLFHIQKVNLTVPNRGGRKAYVTAPRRCGPSRKWSFSMTISNYDGPSVTAGHQIRCRPPRP